MDASRGVALAEFRPAGRKASLFVQHDESPVGRGEDEEQGVQDRLQDFVQEEALSQALRNPQQRLQFGLEADRGLIGDLLEGRPSLREDDELLVPRFVADRNLRRRRPGGRRLGRITPVKLEDHVADADPVAFGDLLPVADRLVVQEGAVGTVQIFQEELVLDAENLRMVTAGIEILDGEVAVRMPAQDQRGLAHLPHRSGSGAVDYLQVSGCFHGNHRQIIAQKRPLVQAHSLRQRSFLRGKRSFPVPSLWEDPAGKTR